MTLLDTGDQEPSGRKFGDSISDNLDLCKQLLGNTTLAGRERAKRAAHQIERVIEELRKAYPNDPAIGLGVMFAITYIGDQLVQSDNAVEGKGLIQLLS